MYIKVAVLLKVPPVACLGTQGLVDVEAVLGVFVLLF